MFLTCFLPVILWAETTYNFIPCGTSSPATCNFEHLKQLVGTVFKYFLEVVIFPIAVGVILYAGFMTVWEASQGKDPTAYRNMLINVVIGFSLALGAYAIVRTVISLFFNEEALDAEIDAVFQQ